MDVIVERFQRRKIVSNPASPMLYYLRQKPKTCGTVDIDVLAASIQKNCAMTKGDVKHVIEALVEEIQGNLANGDKVKLNQLGTFHMTFRCPGMEASDKCTVRNISKVNIRFIPDKELKLVKAGYNAAADRKTTLAELKALKAKGNNTICPDYPQPGWFYDLCDELGLYVIDCANINAPEKRDDRKVGGTPSNDPSLADEYLERVKAMYYRSRNHSCVIAFALGGESGNGYNMYKAYEWLKSVEKSRPVICADADGEWNSDL